MAELHQWTQNGHKWACAAYDHGPFCRLCQIVDDEVAQALLQHVAEGNLEVSAASDGQLLFKTTEQGFAYAGRLVREMGADPDDADSIEAALRRDIAGTN